MENIKEMKELNGFKIMSTSVLVLLERNKINKITYITRKIFLVLNHYTHLELYFQLDINSKPLITVSPCTLQCVLRSTLTASFKTFSSAKPSATKMRHRRQQMEEYEYGVHCRENNDRRKTQCPDKYLPATLPDTYVVSHPQISPVNHFLLLTDNLRFTQFKLRNFKLRNFKRNKKIKSKLF